MIVDITYVLRTSSINHGNSSIMSVGYNSINMLPTFRSTSQKKENKNIKKKKKFARMKKAHVTKNYVVKNVEQKKKKNYF